MGHKLLKDYLHRFQGSIRTALHVGANKAQEQDLWQWLRAERVIWVEAHPDYIQNIRSRLKRTPTQEVHCAMLGDKNEASKDFHVLGHGASSSMFPIAADSCLNQMVRHSVIKVPMVRADTLLREAGVTREELNTLVVDVQGAELQVLRGFGTYLEHVQYVVAEYFSAPAYEGGTTVQDLVLFMLNHGFRLWSKRQQRGDTAALSGNFLFVRGDPVKRGL